MEEGINLLLKERNYAFAGRKVDIIFADTAGQPALARTKTQELVEREKVHVIIGPLATSRRSPSTATCSIRRRRSSRPLGRADGPRQQKKSDYVITSTAPPRSRCTCWANSGEELGLKRIATIAATSPMATRDGGLPARVRGRRGQDRAEALAAAECRDYGSYVGQIKPNIDGVYAGSPAATLALPAHVQGVRPQQAVFGNPTWRRGHPQEMGDEALGVLFGELVHRRPDTPTTSASCRRSRRVQGDARLLHRRHVHGGLWLEEAMKAIKGKSRTKQRS